MSSVQRLFGLPGLLVPLIRCQYTSCQAQLPCMETDIIQGTTPGRRKRGRPMKSWLDDITAWTGLNFESALHVACMQLTVTSGEQLVNKDPWYSQPTLRSRVTENKTRQNISITSRLFCNMLNWFIRDLSGPPGHHNNIGVARIFCGGVHFSSPEKLMTFLVITFSIVICVIYWPPATFLSHLQGVHFTKFTPFLPHFNKNYLKNFFVALGGAPAPLAPPWLRLTLATPA